MERELKIVVIVFLTYLIFGLTTFFQTGSLITPIILTKIILVLLAFIFLLMNLKEQDYWILVYALFGFIAFASTDDFVISYLSKKIDGFELFFTETNFFNWLSFFVFFSFLFAAILFFWIKKKNKSVSLFLLGDLLLCLFLFFTDLGWVQEVSIKVFFLVFFVACQSDFDVKNKTLRVLSYLFLGLVLLESFEYFI
jgi:hypothetical protein